MTEYNVEVEIKGSLTDEQTDRIIDTFTAAPYSDPIIGTQPDHNLLIVSVDVKHIIDAVRLVLSALMRLGLTVGSVDCKATALWDHAVISSLSDTSAKATNVM